MQTKRKTMIATGAAKGIGTGVTNAFIEFAATDRLAEVPGDIGDPSTAGEIASTAIKTFGSIDGVVNYAGIFFTKPFTEYTEQDFEKLSGTNLQGYIYVTQLAVKQMLTQYCGGSVTCVTSAMVEHPSAGINGSFAMVTKGGLELVCSEIPDVVLSVTRALADDDLATTYARLPSVDFSRDILAHQTKRLLVFRDSGSGWADLSPNRVLGLSAKNVNQPAWFRQPNTSSRKVRALREVV
jgi:NAD(P)-dependent dehydrogenase (short-subunit alcohol dehydrogenase family)